MQSYASNCLKTASEDLTLEQFNELEKRKSKYLAMADKFYTNGLDVPYDALSVDERWLMRYMRGKIREKRGEEISAWLEEYMKATELLYDAVGPIAKKIIYNTPTEFALELLEVQYRIHTSILKMELKAAAEGKEPSVAQVKVISDFIKRLRNMYIFNGGKQKTSRPKQTEVVDVEAEAAKEEVNLTWEQIIQECISTLENIVNLFPQHFKSLFQLARFYAKCPRRRNIQKAKNYLLLPGISTKAVSGFMPLFGERKSNNFFNGIWRMPLTEFDRAGSFSRHVGRCVALLFDVAKETGEYQVLCDAACLLKKPPEGDRQYLFEEDRVQFSTEAHTKMILAFAQKTNKLTEKVDGVKNRKELTEEVKFLLDMFNTFNRLKRFGKADDKLKPHLMKMYEWLFSKTPRSFDEVNSVCQRILQLDRTAIRGGACNTACSLSEIIKHIKQEKELEQSVKARAKDASMKEAAVREAASAAVMLQAAQQQQQYYKEVLSLAAAYSATGTSASSAEQELMLAAAAVAASPQLASQYSQYVTAAATAAAAAVTTPTTSTAPKKRDLSAESKASAMAQMPKQKKPKVQQTAGGNSSQKQIKPAGTSSNSSRPKSMHSASPATLPLSLPASSVASIIAAAAAAKKPQVSPSTASQKPKSSLSIHGKFVTTAAQGNKSTAAKPVQSVKPGPASVKHAAAAGTSRPTSAAPSRPSSGSTSTMPSSSPAGTKFVSMQGPSSSSVSLPGPKPRAPPTAVPTSASSMVQQAKAMFGTATKASKLMGNPLLLQVNVLQKTLLVS